MNTKNRVIKVTTSEIEIITRHYTYEVVVPETQIKNFINTMDGLCGYSEIYGELDKYKYTYISRTDGKEYPNDDNYSAEIDELKIID